MLDCSHGYWLHTRWYQYNQLLQGSIFLSHFRWFGQTFGGLNFWIPGSKFDISCFVIFLWPCEFVTFFTSTFITTIGINTSWTGATPFLESSESGRPGPSGLWPNIVLFDLSYETPFHIHRCSHIWKQILRLCLCNHHNIRIHNCLWYRCSMHYPDKNQYGASIHYR